MTAPSTAPTSKSNLEASAPTPAPAPAPANTWTWLYRAAWLICRAVTFTFFRTRVITAGNVPPTGPVILAANHASFIDPPLIGCCVHRPVNYLGRESLFRPAPVKRFLVGLNCVPVDRDGGGAAGLKAILGRLQKGGAILLFPEGTRTSDGNIQSARAGVGLAIIKSPALVVPVRIFGSFEAFNRFHRFPRPKKIVVRYGVPIDFTALRKEAETCDKNRLKAIYQEAADRVMAEIQRLEPTE